MQKRQLEERDLYQSSEVAQIIVALFNSNTTLPPDDINDPKRYEKFIPKNILGAYTSSREEHLPAEKEFYSPLEIIEMYKLYFKAYGEGPTDRIKLFLYKQMTPLNVLNSIVNLNGIINDYHFGKRKDLGTRAKEGNFEAILKFLGIIP